MAREGTLNFVTIRDFIAAWPDSPFAGEDAPPWAVTANASSILTAVIPTLDQDYAVERDIALHKLATVEPGAVVKGPAIIGPGAFVASSAYLRGGVFLDRDCIVGPGCEVKTSFLFAGAKIAHLSFVGDSLLGGNVNVEAGAIVANYRNELDDKRILIRWRETIIDTGVEKFGALIGDDAKIGANAVIAPGALIAPGARIARLAHIDQRPQT